VQLTGTVRSNFSDDAARDYTGTAVNNPGVSSYDGQPFIAAMFTRWRGRLTVLPNSAERFANKLRMRRRNVGAVTTRFRVVGCHCRTPNSL